MISWSANFDIPGGLLARFINAGMTKITRINAIAKINSIRQVSYSLMFLPDDKADIPPQNKSLRNDNVIGQALDKTWN